MKHSKPTLTRRRMMQTGATALAGLTLKPSLSRPESSVPHRPGVPLIHVTDLYHPPQDPDDSVDLLTIAALKEIDLKAVILDVTEKFLEPAPLGFDKKRDPGFVPVMQLGYLLGRHIPAAMGPMVPLKSADDAATDRSPREQAGISLLLKVLEESPDPVLISSVGSVRVVTAAFNRRPELLRSKVKAVLLNAGSTGGTKREWNVSLDFAAYIGLWRSGLPIRWYPCATERSAFNPDHERGTYWKSSQAELFRGSSQPLRAWITYSFGGSTRGDSIHALSEDVDASAWEAVCADHRNLWSTASLIMAANRVLARTSGRWRFVARHEAKGLETWPWRLDAIEAAVNGDGQVDWSITEAESRYQLFGRQRGSAFGSAMTEALNALLISLPIDTAR